MEASSKANRGSTLKLKEQPPKKVKIRAAPKTISGIANIFLTEIQSLQLAQSETKKVLAASATAHVNSFTKLMKGFQQLEAGTDTKKFAIPPDQIDEVTRQLRDLAASTGSISLTHRGLFLVLVSKWDAYFGTLLRWVYSTRPEIIDSSARTISFSDLMKINSIEKAKSKIVEDEVSTVLRDSHDDQFSYLERKLGLSLRKIEIWSNFIEITQRRNLIAHTDGVVSQQYLETCNQNRITLPPGTEVGVELQIDDEYLRKSCDCFAEMGFKLAQVLWRKLKPEEISKAEAHLISTTFEMIKAEQYRLAIKILDFALSSPMKFEESRSRFISIVNLAQAYKWSGDDAKCSNILDTEDWSAASPDLLLAVAVLKGQFKEAVKLMRTIGPKGAVSKEDYQTWPLFKAFRNTKDFSESFFEIFNTEFVISSPLPEIKTALSLHPSTELPAISDPLQLSKRLNSRKKSKAHASASEMKPVKIGKSKGTKQDF